MRKLILIIIVLAGGYVGYRFFTGKSLSVDAMKEDLSSAAEEAGPGEYAKAELEWQKGRYEDAIRLYEAALDEAEGDIRANCLRRIGNCYKRLYDKTKDKAKAKKAIEYYNKVIEEFPDDRFTGQVRNERDKLKMLM